MEATLFQAIVLVYAVTLVNGQCPNSTWVRRGHKCYFLKREKGDFFENLALCNELNASLVSITSEEENYEVTQIVDDFWLGLGQKSKYYDNLYWFDGSPFIYSNWKSEPEDKGIKYWAEYSEEGKWNSNIFLAFAKRTQLCSINLNASTFIKKTPNPAEIKETLVSGQCPNSTWIRLGNKCYFVKREEADLYENIALCNQLNASLVSIASEAENIQVNRLMSQTWVISIWLGLGQKSKYSRDYYWFDGSPFVYSSWEAEREPQVLFKYFGAFLLSGEWQTTTAFLGASQVCSLDLRLNASPEKIPNPAELIETEGQCPGKPWKRVGNKCIFLSRRKEVTYMENQALCKELNATMVSIHSDAENIRLAKFSGYDNFWIGIKQTSKSNRMYEWEDGSPVTYESWRQVVGTFFLSEHRAAYSWFGEWQGSQKSSYNYPCCQISLLTKAEAATTKGATGVVSQLTTTARNLNTVSKST